MRPRHSLALTLIFAMLLPCSACSLHEEPADILEKSEALLQGGYRCPLTLSAENTTAEGQLHWTAESQTLTLQSPEALSGLSFTLSPSGLLLELEGIRQPLLLGQLLDSSAARLLFESLSQLSPQLCEEETAPELSLEDGQLSVLWPKVTLTLDAASGAPLLLEGEYCQIRFGEGEGMGSVQRLP